MRFLPTITLLYAALCLVDAAYGAGDVIQIGASGGLYTVAGGRTDISGFADHVYVEDDADGFPLATSVSGFGSAYLWTNPGVRMDGLLNNSGLYIEALVRPVKDASPARDRVLWYWNPTNGQIEDVPEDNHFVIYKGFASQGIFLSGTTSTPQTPLRIAGPVAADMGFDSYGTYLRFALHRVVPPPSGVYGIFARFTSDFYPPSDPFLIVFNQGQLSGAQMLAGALAINAAGDDASNLAGDFDGDGTVDASDYTVWRNGLGSLYTQEHYTEWKNNFGATQGGGSSTVVANVPEPAGLMLSIVAVWGVLVPGSRPARRLKAPPRHAVAFANAR